MKYILIITLSLFSFNILANAQLDPELEKLLNSASIYSETVIPQHQGSSLDFYYILTYSFISLLTYGLFLKKGNVQDIPDGAVIAMVPSVIWPIILPLFLFVLVKDFYMNKYVYCQDKCDIDINKVTISRDVRDPHHAKCPKCQRQFYYDHFGSCYEDYKCRTSRFMKGDLDSRELRKLENKKDYRQYGRGARA